MKKRKNSDKSTALTDRQRPITTPTERHVGPEKLIFCTKLSL